VNEPTATSAIAVLAVKALRIATAIRLFFM